MDGDGRESRAEPADRLARMQDPRPPGVRSLRTEIRVAAERLRPYVVRTPVERSSPLSRLGRADVWLKHEEFQHTGSFKFRGATNKLLALPERVRERGVIAASTGNHGIAVAEALVAVGGTGTVVVPRGAAASKVARIRARGVRVVVHGDDCVVAEAHARRLAERSGQVFISPYNDLDVIAGQGTVGVELADAPGALDAVFAAVGGGGLIAGTAAWLTRGRRPVRIIGAQPKHSDVMRRSLAAGRILDVPSKETLSDGTAGGIEPDAVTFDLCRTLVDEVVTVTEKEIERALRFLFDEHQVLVEGAAATAVAAYRKARKHLEGKRVAIILCGRNIGGDTARRILTDHSPTHR